MVVLCDVNGDQIDDLVSVGVGHELFYQAGLGLSATVPPVPLFSAQPTNISQLAAQAAGLPPGSSYSTPGGDLQDRTEAALMAVQVEGNSRAGFGGGLSIEIMGVEDDLFEDVAGDPQEISTLEVSPYFLYHVAAGDRFLMPIRLGPWIHVLALDDPNNSIDVDWISLGLRLQLEPEVTLVRNSDFSMSVFTALTFAGGETAINLSGPGIDEELESEAGMFGFEIGPRLRFSHFIASVSYLHRSSHVDESDPDPNFVVFGFDNSYDGIAFSFGGSL